MKNILVISASPRKGGNSDVLCDEFIKGAQKAGHKVEKIFLRNFKVNYCTGCGVCNSTHKCVQKDDMAEIMDKMVNSDVIVFATPVYFYTMDAQLKTLIDRTVPRYTEMVNKEVYYILTAADTNYMLFVQRNIDSELIICYTFIIRGTDEVRCILWVDKKL